MTGNRSLQRRFIQSLQTPPLDLPERLERDSGQRIWMMGTGLDRLVEHFVDRDEPDQELFVCDPSFEGEEEDEGNLRRFGGSCLERLGTFQQGTFQVCLACWMVGTVPVTDTLSMLYRVLDSSSGQVGLVTMKEGAPKGPLRLLKKVVREVAGKKIQFQRRGQLASVDALRSQITSLGFHHERVWENELEVTFHAPEEVFTVLQHSTRSPETKEDREEFEKIRTEFCSRVEDRYGSEPNVTYTYLGATAHCRG